MSRDRDLQEVSHALGYAEAWEKQARGYLISLFPEGALVEVQLRQGQKTWTPATVMRVGWRAGYMNVRLVKPPRYRESGMVKHIHYERIRPRGQT